MSMRLFIEPVPVSGKGISWYKIRREEGTWIGTAEVNLSPIGKTAPVTIEEAKRYALLWAAAEEMLYFLEKFYIDEYAPTAPSIEYALKHAPADADPYEQSIIDVIKRAKGL